jgi:hypothetical protein
MGRHPKHFDNALAFDDLLHQTVLNINSAGIGGKQVAEKSLERRRFPEKIFGEDVEKLLRLRPESR